MTVVQDLHLELNETFSEEQKEEQERVTSQVEQIANTRTKAKQSQTKQANQMLAGNKKVINSFKVGDLVLLPVDVHDLGSADAPNLECIILEKIGDIQYIRRFKRMCYL